MVKDSTMMTFIISTLVALSSMSVFSDASSLHWNSETQITSNSFDSIPSEKQYYFVADGRKRPYAYIDEYGGLVGFDVDLVKAVCGLANKKCNFILAEYQECIFTYKTMTYAGRGLQSKWFDACPGYGITNDRKINFDFTLPYIKTFASFTVAPGNPKRFNPDKDDYSKFNLIHLSGAPTNNQCLNRLGKKFANITTANDLPEAKEALLNGTVDVLFSPRSRISGLEVLPQRFKCSDLGAGVMVTKGSDLPFWWDEAYSRYYMSGDFTTLCEEGGAKYGATPSCLLPGEEESKELEALMRQRMSLPRALPEEEKLWKFVVSGKLHPYSFLDNEGNLVGFTQDMLLEVCRRAGKKCTLMTAKVSECTIRPRGEIMYPGRGLSDGWFDGCTGYFNTLDRFNSWDFTSPYLASAATFRVKKGNPSGFDPSSFSLEKFTIVYLETAISNDHCLARLHKKAGKLVVVSGEDVATAVEMVQNGTADAWFSKYHHPTNLETLPQEFHCENVGTSIMVKKGSKIPSWYNPAFEAWYMTGGFNRFCESQGDKYGVTFPCIPPPPTSEQKHNPSLRVTEEGF